MFIRKLGFLLKEMCRVFLGFFFFVIMTAQYGQLSVIYSKFPYKVIGNFIFPFFRFPLISYFLE